MDKRLSVPPFKVERVDVSSCKGRGWAGHTGPTGMINMSFFFLNRFLDIADAIEDPENAAIDNTDFMDTDIPSPYARGPKTQRHRQLGVWQDPNHLSNSGLIQGCA